MGKTGGCELGSGFSGEVELSVIRGTLKIDYVFTKDITKGKKVNDEEEGIQDWAPGARLKWQWRVEMYKIYKWMNCVQQER